MAEPTTEIWEPINTACDHCLIARSRPSPPPCRIAATASESRSPPCTRSRLIAERGCQLSVARPAPSTEPSEAAGAKQRKRQEQKKMERGDKAGDGFRAAWGDPLSHLHLDPRTRPIAIPLAPPDLIRSMPPHGDDHHTRKEAVDRVFDVVKSIPKMDPSKVTPDAHFQKDLRLDSLDTVEIVMALEEEFKPKIPDKPQSLLRITTARAPPLPHRPLPVIARSTSPPPEALSPARAPAPILEIFDVVAEKSPATNLKPCVFAAAAPDFCQPRPCSSSPPPVRCRNRIGPLPATALFASSPPERSHSLTSHANSRSWSVLVGRKEKGRAQTRAVIGKRGELKKKENKKKPFFTKPSCFKNLQTPASRCPIRIATA